MNDIQDALARKYAQAFVHLNFAHMNDALADRIYALSRYFDKHRRALFYVQLTTLDGDATKKNFDELFNSSGVDHLFGSLIDLLLLHRRIALLPRIMSFIYYFYLQKQGIMEFTIESPLDLTESELSQLHAFLEEKTGKRIRYYVRKNPDLIAGIKLYSSTLGFERSIRQYLRLLSTSR